MSVQYTDSKVVEIHHVCRSSSQDNNVAHTKDDRKARETFVAQQTNIGWWTPLVVVGSFLAATTIAIVHYVYCRVMDRRFVDYTIRQSWNNALSVTFAHLFATALATSVSTASTQLLWWYLRKKSLSVSKIDALFALNSSSSNLYRLGVLKSIPVLWFFGLLIPLISVATIFPPGSLVIGQLPDFENSTDWVYTLDIDNRGSGNASDFFSHATFEINTNGEYL